MISMSANTGAFTAGIEAFSKKSQERIQRTFQRAVLELFRRVVNRTPVDTGRLKAGWQIGSSVTESSELGAEATTATGRTRRVESKAKNVFTRQGMRTFGRWGTRYVKAGRGTFDKSGKTTISSGRAAIGTLSMGDSVYIFNNVRYAQYVEYGPPYPRGMLRISMSEWPSIVTAAAAGAV